jgi:zinc/manganese transport system substrate-binding protein
MSKAHVVIENGGGYDDFMDTMRKAAHNSSATVINAVDVSGKQAQQGADLNEHVWYDFSTVTAVVERIRSALARALPAGAPTFAVNATGLTGRIAAMQHTEAAIKAGNAGRGVAITEPVPLYLLQACGLVNRTPPAFSKAVEEESDVSPRVLSDTLALFDARQVALLAYNSQTTSATTDRVIAAAKARAVPTVPVTETLPAGKTYVAWMTDTLTAVRSALSS